MMEFRNSDVKLIDIGDSMVLRIGSMAMAMRFETSAGGNGLKGPLRRDRCRRIHLGAWLL